MSPPAAAKRGRSGERRLAARLGLGEGTFSTEQSSYFLSSTRRWGYHLVLGLGTRVLLRSSGGLWALLVVWPGTGWLMMSVTAEGLTEIPWPILEVDQVPAISMPNNISIVFICRQEAGFVLRTNKSTRTWAHSSRNLHADRTDLRSAVISLETACSNHGMYMSCPTYAEDN